MNINLDLTLSILVVDDDNTKREKIISVLNGISQNKIQSAFDQISAQKYLLNEKFDLLILDMQLPVRFGEGDPEKDGGQKILEELAIDDSYKQPTCIIALTEFDDLQANVREQFSDIAAIKFELTSLKWEDSLKRVIGRLKNNKSISKNIVYCEGGNAFFYNLTGLHNIEFRGLTDSRAVFLSAKNEKDKFALRDRDFLTNKEIRTLRSKHSNYFILGYYCFENYLYHPENISELIPDFDKESYINDITVQKKSKLMTIVQDYKLSRNGYYDLNGENKDFMDKKPEDEIIISLESDEFESFYPFFDMAGKKDPSNKKSFDKTFLSTFNLDHKDLVKTNWFKSKVSEILKPLLT